MLQERAHRSRGGSGNFDFCFVRRAVNVFSNAAKSYACFAELRVSFLGGNVQKSDVSSFPSTVLDKFRYFGVPAEFLSNEGAVKR